MFWPRITCDIEKTRENCKEYNHNAPSEAHLSAEPINPLPTPLEQVFADFFNLRVVIISLSVTVCPEGPRFIVRHREANMLVLRPWFDVCVNFSPLSEFRRNCLVTGAPSSLLALRSSFYLRRMFVIGLLPLVEWKGRGRRRICEAIAWNKCRTNQMLEWRQALMLHHRKTPDPDCNVSPAEIVFRRPIHDDFSFCNRREKFSNPEIRCNRRQALRKLALRKRFGRWSEGHNEHSKTLRLLRVGQRCFFFKIKRVIIWSNGLVP